MSAVSGESTALVPVSRWIADRFLALCAAVRRFNADQVALREHWLARHGSAARR